MDLQFWANTLHTCGVEVIKEETLQSLLVWLFDRAFKVSSGTFAWYRSSCGTDFDKLK